jgi:hypothetical protein
MILLKKLLNERLIESNDKRIVYHVTRGKHLKSILKNGLIPASPSLGRDEFDDMGVYFFPDYEALQDGWDAWMEDFFDDDEDVYILTVDITDLPAREGGDYEIIVNRKIPPDRIISYKKLE